MKFLLVPYCCACGYRFLWVFSRSAIRISQIHVDASFTPTLSEVLLVISSSDLYLRSIYPLAKPHSTTESLKIIYLPISCLKPCFCGLLFLSYLPPRTSVLEGSFAFIFPLSSLPDHIHLSCMSFPF